MLLLENMIEFLGKELCSAVGKETLIQEMELCFLLLLFGVYSSFL